MYDQELFLSTLSGFTRTLLRAYDVDEVLQDLVERVSAVLGLAGSGVCLVIADRLTFATALPNHLTSVERAQVDAQAGPSVQACRTRAIVAVPDVHERAQAWPAYCAAATQAGISAAAGIPMHLQDTMVGALDLCADGPRDWAVDDLAVAQVLADMATAYLINASQLRQHQQLNEQLQQALDSRVVIEQAKGLVAGAHDVSLDHAFKLIRAHARNHNTSLRAVAGAIAHLGLKLKR